MNDHGDATFRDQLIEASRDALLILVKIVIVAGGVLLASGWIFGDYMAVRRQAQHGEQVYQIMLRQQQAQQAAPAKKVTP